MNAYILIYHLPNQHFPTESHLSSASLLVCGWKWEGEKKKEGGREKGGEEGERGGRSMRGGVKKHERAKDRNRGSAESGWRRMSRGRRETVWVPPSLKNTCQTDTDFSAQTCRHRDDCEDGGCGGYVNHADQAEEAIQGWDINTRGLTHYHSCTDRRRNKQTCVSSHIHSNTWTQIATV